MKPGDLIRAIYTNSRAFPVFRGKEMCVILEETEHDFVVLFTNGKVDHGTQAYFLNYYQVIS